MNITTAMGHGDLDEVGQNWGWWMALGILMIVLGALASSMAVATTVVTVIFFGAILLVSGVAQIVSAFRDQVHGSFWIHLLAGVLDLVVGALLLIRPVAGAVVLTLVLAAFFFVGGIYRAIGAISLRLPSWGWNLLSGAVDVLLAILLLVGWPYSGLWFLGFCVGIGLIFRGWAWVMLSLVVRAAHKTA